MSCGNLGGSKRRKKLEEGAAADYEALFGDDCRLTGIFLNHLLLFAAKPEPKEVRVELRQVLRFDCWDQPLKVITRNFRSKFRRHVPAGSRAHLRPAHCSGLECGQMRPAGKRLFRNA